MKKSTKTLKGLKKYVKSLKVSEGTETFIKDEILSLIDIAEEEDDDDNGEDIIGTIQDECHDGAYEEGEVENPFTEEELEDFLNKFELNID